MSLDRLRLCYRITLSVLLNRDFSGQTRDLGERGFQQVHFGIKVLCTRFHLCNDVSTYSNRHDGREERHRTHRCYRVAGRDEFVVVVIHEGLSFAVQLSNFCITGHKEGCKLLQIARVPLSSSFSFRNSEGSEDVVMSCS